MNNFIKCDIDKIINCNNRIFYLEAKIKKLRILFYSMLIFFSNVKVNVDLITNYIFEIIFFSIFCNFILFMYKLFRSFFK